MDHHTSESLGYGVGYNALFSHIDTHKRHVPAICRGFTILLPAGKSYAFESWDFTRAGPLARRTIIISLVCVPFRTTPGIACFCPMCRISEVVVTIRCSPAPKPKAKSAAETEEAFLR